MRSFLSEFLERIASEIFTKTKTTFGDPSSTPQSIDQNYQGKTFPCPQPSFISYMLAPLYAFSDIPFGYAIPRTLETLSYQGDAAS